MDNEKEVKKPKAKPAPKPIATFKERWSDEFKHDLFKLMAADCKRNRSYQKFKPKIVIQNHGHIFHSISRKGTPQKYCLQMAGHFHEITVEWDGPNLISAHCGPPMQYKWREDRSGIKKRVLEPVRYRGVDPQGTQDVVDSHVHELRYEGSEMVNVRPNVSANSQQMLSAQMGNKYSASVLAQAQQTIKG